MKIMRQRTSDGQPTAAEEADAATKTYHGARRMAIRTGSRARLLPS